MFTKYRELTVIIPMYFSGGESACNFAACPDSPLKPFAEAYHADPDLWMRRFVGAYTKMTSTVAADVQLKTLLHE